jgi:hypothetical protein
MQESELHKQREQLMKQHHEHVERKEVIDSYLKEADAYDKLIKDV